VKPPRTLVIGLDGATFDLIQPLVQAGDLPTIRTLMARGCYGTLQAWPNMNSAAAWGSMVTGYDSGHHSVCHFARDWFALLQRGTKSHLTTGADLKRDPFWRLLSAGGQQVGIINVPISYPAESINGFMLAGMDAPGVSSSGFAHPPELYDELRHQGIDYAIDTLSLAETSRRAPYLLPDPIKRLVNARARTILYLMQTRSWDVLMGVFVATDRVQHYFWPGAQTSIEDPSWIPIRALYQLIDQFLADALALTDENTTMLIVSDHGFGPRRSAMHSLNALFAQMGLLKYKRGVGSWPNRFLGSLLRQGRRRIPVQLQYPLAHTFPILHFRAVTATLFSSIAWDRTKVFADPDGWGVFINLRGRGPEGIVPQQDYASLRDRVQHTLQSLIDPVSRRRIIRTVLPCEQVYRGPYLEHAPDLVVDWDYAVVGDLMTYSDGREIFSIDFSTNPVPGESWGATHRPDGILIAAGRDIKPGSVLTDAHVHDIAPTLLYLNRQPIPTDMEGRVLVEIFAEERLKRIPIVQKESAPVATRTDTQVLDSKDEEILEKRLRDLGYIE
jgi:predicted AlkP superfamily phosphohydrolase/phosphomutase